MKSGVSGLAVWGRVHCTSGSDGLVCSALPMQHGGRCTEYSKDFESGEFVTLWLVNTRGWSRAASVGTGRGLE